MCCTALSPGIDALNYPAFLFVTPMTLFTGTFFPLDQMPVILQEIAIIFLPLTHVVALMRMLTLASPSWIGLLSLVWICAITALICLVAINLMKRRLIV
jgi:lipooligosaccharide transport system permease protein